MWEAGISYVVARPIDDVKSGWRDVAEAVDGPHCAMMLGGVDVHRRTHTPEDIRQDLPAIIGLLRIWERRPAVEVMEYEMAGGRYLHPDLRAVFLSRIAPGLGHVVKAGRADRHLHISRHLPA